MSAVKIFCLFLFAGAFYGTKAQTADPAPPRQLGAKRFTGVIKIDGNLNDTAWKNATTALGYTEFQPTPFKAEADANRTESYIIYNDEGIYIGGYCHERTKDSISTELTGRDGFGNNDYVGFIFDTYKDKINGFEYFVTPLGEQWDAKMAPNPNGNSEDFTWNAVWYSAAQIQPDGWSFEMFLPFSAIRFSKKEVQDWGFNITRKRQKTGQQVTWNPINPNINGFLPQEGFWTGLENIKPPLRLQFSPYFSTYVNHYPNNKPGQSNFTNSVNGGMDVKYGLTPALTLDMTLVPDFGQVQSDNQVLNLTPFEVKYNENRSFFTEGTELFNKGNLFYSRRIGGTPLHYDDVKGKAGTNGKVLKNPVAARLINATKISGRLQGGLGIGVLNAIEAPQYATYEDATGKEGRTQTSPLTNYNIIVLDQTLKHNSSVSLVNTNVTRKGTDYDANVTAALFDLYDKKNTWNVGGKVSTSNLMNYLPGGKTATGYNHKVYFGKVSGRFNFNLSQELMDAKYDISDLGYFTNNNFLDHSLWMGYNWIKPGTWYNRINLNFNAYYSRRFEASAYQNASVNINANGQLKNLWYTGFTVGYEPKTQNFYEPRVAGRVFKGWSDYFVDAWVQTNDAKKYSGYAEILYIDRSMFTSKKYNITLQHQYRFNNNFTASHSLSLSPEARNVGFADKDSANIYFGTRNRQTIENILNLKYNFSQKVWFTTRIRHYWSRADYTRFFTLQPDGTLKDKNDFTGNVNQNYNFFNIDAVFTWQFGPGSFINVVWKNAVNDFDGDVQNRYFKNLSHTLAANQNNNLSFRILYFLDYQRLKKRSHVTNNINPNKRM